MRKPVVYAALIASLTGIVGFSTSARADTGQVAVVFTKGGFIVGAGGGEGVLLYRGKKYPFTVSGMSVGLTIGASTTKFTGRALNLEGAGVHRRLLRSRRSGRRHCCRSRRRAVAERQWRDPSTQRPQGRRGSVGCRWRGHDPSEVIGTGDGLRHRSPLAFNIVRRRNSFPSGWPGRCSVPCRCASAA